MRGVTAFTVLGSILSAAEAAPANLLRRQDTPTQPLPLFSLNIEAPGQTYDGLFVAISESQNAPPYYSNYISKYQVPYFSVNGNDKFGLAYSTDGFPGGPMKRRDNTDKSNSTTTKLIAVTNDQDSKAFSFVAQQTALDDFGSIDFGFAVGQDGYVRHTTGGDWAVCGSGSYADSLIRVGDHAANCTNVKLKAMAPMNGTVAP